MRDVLATRGLCRSFGSIQVLHDIDLEFRAGEVHAIIGENGAGKSTLMKLLSGYLAPSAGELLIDGAPALLAGGDDGERRGIVLIHQEFNLAEDLSVEENVFLGRELKRGWFLDKAAMAAKTRAYLSDLDCAIDPSARVSGLSVSEKQMVEIAKAVSRDARVLIMDEPTAVLTASETAVLFRLIARLKAQGVTILYISHKLDEVEAIADRVTVLRDGRLIITRDAQGLSQDEMARLMVGRELSDMYPPKPAAPATEIVLEVENISVPGYVSQAGFALRRGEILGLAGLVGSGRTELIEGVLGLRHRTSGRIRRDGREIAIADPAEAARHGIVYLTEDRKGKGLLLSMALRPNVTLMALKRHVRRGFVDTGSENRALHDAVRRFDIRSGRRDALAGNLSGGNQQKLMLAKYMAIDPEIVIVDEPTRGIDVGTKRQIYQFVAELAAQGRSVIVISSEMPEIIGLCHRVLIMRAGRIVGEATGDAIHEDEIVRYATGLKGAA